LATRLREIISHQPEGWSALLIGGMSVGLSRIAEAA
jgi:hypothetical protein